MLFVVIDLFDHLSDFIQKQTPFVLVVKYYFALMPSLLVYVMPISLLLALLYMLWQMMRHNEIIAMRASGIGLGRIMLPVILVGIFASVLVSLVNELIAPKSTYWALQFVERVKSGKDTSLRYTYNLPFKNETEYRIWKIGTFDSGSNILYDAEIVQERTDGSKSETYQAKEARFYDGQWWLFDVSIQQHDYYNYPIGLPRKETIYQTASWSEKPEDFKNEIIPPELLAVSDLKGYVKKRKNLSATTRANYLVNMHSKLAMPWTCLVVVLFGIPCGLRTARQGALIGIIAAIIAFFGFYFLMMFGQWLGKMQVINPFTAGWLPNIIFFLMGLLMFWRVK
jgi:lipopolysaccharide export system permease protein